MKILEKSLVILTRVLITAIIVREKIISLTEAFIRVNRGDIDSVKIFDCFELSDKRGSSFAGGIEKNLNIVKALFAQKLK